jgi:hypothetical protein
MERFVFSLAVPRGRASFAMLKTRQPYRHDIERIAQDLIGCEPEVCLAVKVAHRESYSADEDEDDSETDAFLSSHGFEYVDAIDERSLQAFGLREEEDYTGSVDFTRVNDMYIECNFSGIPRIPRIIDALSTIMWPSMETKTKKASKNVQEKDRDFLDWARSSQDDRSSEIEEPLNRSDTASLGSTRSRVREMQELARWLEEDNSVGGGDPWAAAASSTGISLSPAAMDFENRETPDSDLRFDDDFTVFVSAPAVDLDDGSYNNSGPPSPDLSTLVPHVDLYRSLGSVSDFGGSDDEKRGNDVENDDDDDLPTQEEIRATSSRIYGIAETTTEPDPGSPSGPRSAGSILPISDTFSFDSLHSELDRDGSYEMAPFDLSKVLGTLQEMKAEIGRMDDEGERRKAAARVALGLVYGLEER